MPLYNPTQIPVNLTASSATATSVSSTITSTSLLAANSDRKGATIWNNSTANLFIDFGATSATDNYSVRISPDGYFELPFRYTGAISGIWDNVNGEALIREFV